MSEMSYNRKIIDGQKASAHTTINAITTYLDDYKETNANAKNEESAKYNDLLDLNEFIEESKTITKEKPPIYQQVGATVAVTTTSILSGVLDIGESLLDGVVWCGSTIASWFGADTTEAKEFIARDLVTEANENFYENTDIGQSINNASYMKYKSETAQKIRTISEKVTIFAAATVATPLAAGGLGFAYGTGNAAENTYATKGTNTSAIDELLILADGGLSTLSWYTTGQLGKGFLEIGKAMSEASVQEIIAQMAKEIFSKDMLKELLKPGNLVGNAISTLMQTGGDIALIATKLYNGQEVTPDEWNILVGELIVYFGLNLFEDVLMTEITGYKSGNIESIKTNADSPSFSESKNPNLSTEEISKYIDDYMLDPDLTPPMGIPTALIDFLDSYRKDPGVTPPSGIPKEFIDYLNSKYTTPIFDTPPTTQYKPTELSPKVQELLNKIRSRSPINAQNMKYEIMKTAEGLQDPILIAKKLYNELNKRVNYNVDYMDMAFGDVLPSAAMDIYMKPLSFNSLDSNQVICKGWSELYTELLIEAGYKPEQIRILGGSKIGSHKWVSIDLGNGYSIVADATNAIKGKTDLYNCKIGETSQGFLVVSSDIIDQKIASPIHFYKWYESQPNGPEYLAQMQDYIKNIDTHISYSDQSTKIQRAQKLFSDDGLVSEIMMESPESYLATNILNNPISPSTGIDGLEAFVYYRNAIRNILGKNNSGIIENELYKPKNSSNYESVNVITINADNGPIYQIYSKNTGQIIIDSKEQFLEFIKNFDLILN